MHFIHDNSSEPAGDRNLSHWVERHFTVASLIVIFCSLAMRLFFTLLSDQAMLVTNDAVTYFVPAQKLLEQGAFLNAQNAPEISRTPGYPAFVAGIIYVFGGDWRRVLIVQTVLLSFTGLISYWTARMIFPPLTAFIGALVAAFSPWGAVLAGLPLAEGPFLLVLSLIFLTMKLVQQQAQRGWSIFFGAASIGLLTGAAVLIRPLWPLVIFVLLGMLFVYGLRTRGVWLVLATIFVFSVAPLFLWKERNRHVSNFNGFTDISGQTALVDLAARVTAQVNGQDRWLVKKNAALVSRKLNLSLPRQELYEERWRRANAVFREHPIATVYCFLLNATEHVIHPSPDVLSPSNLTFPGDYWVLGLLWIVLLLLSALALPSKPHRDKDATDRGWVLALLVICGLLTLTTGIAFGSGSRYRVSMELIIPFLAAEGLLRVIGPRA